MQPLRAFLTGTPLATFAILFAALALRVMVPAGFMPVVQDGKVLLAACSGYGQMMAEPAAAAPMHHDMTHAAMSGSGLTHHEGGAHPPTGSETSQSACAFADLSLPVIGGADPVQLAAAILFIVLAALFAVKAIPVRAAPRLRPPLRAPPHTI